MVGLLLRGLLQLGNDTTASALRVGLALLVAMHSAAFVVETGHCKALK